MRTVRLPLALLCLGVAACKADSFPTAVAADVAGTYKLTAINGLALPFPFRPDSTLTVSATDTTVSRETLYREEYEFLPTGRFHYTIVDSGVTHVTDGSVDTKQDYSFIFAGRWGQSGSTLLLTADSITTPGNPRVALTTPATSQVPLPTNNAISPTYAITHNSLGSSSGVTLNYTFVYTKQ